MKKATQLLVLLGCFGFCITTQASTIVDTGSGDSSAVGVYVNNSQRFAGLFDVSNSYTISSVEGWFSELTEGTVTAVIYSDFGTGIPGAELFSEQFTLDAPSAGNNAWDGAYNLSWLIDSSSYWLAFEVRSGDTGFGGMPVGSVPNPLADYAYMNYPIPGTWTSATSSYGLGMRINAISAVPIPAATWLFGSALLGFVGFARRRSV